MIDRVIEFSIRHRWGVILAGLALALAGVYAVYQTPMDAIPDLSENQVIVFTEWKGHSPKEIEDQVTYPLSLNLQGIAGVKTVRGSSDVNFSMIHVIFEDSADYASARRQVGERLAQAATVLPPGVTPALGPDAAATGQIFWYTLEGPGYDLGRLRAVQDWYVRPQLSSVPGVAEAAGVGGFPLEYHVEVDPERVRARGVALGDVVRAVAEANTASGGDVVQKSNAEYLARAPGWLGLTAAGEFDPKKAVRDLENTLVPSSKGPLVKLSDVAGVGVGPGARRGVLEKDGSEVVGGVVMMRWGENPLEVTRRLKEKIQELQVGLPPGVRLVPFYDRTPLIQGAVATVTGTLTEAIVTAIVCVLLVLLHFRTSLIIAVTLPLAALASFALMWLLRRLGVADIQTNIMSLAGLAVSIGVLVDSSVVMAENVMFTLKNHFGDRPVHGDVRHLVLPACQMVGRPIFFSVVIMLLSFLPVFVLGGMEGKMFHPLAFTKSFALTAVAVLTVTLVPALCTIFIKGRLRAEHESWLVRTVVQVYRPVLDYVLDRPAPLAWVLGVTFLAGLAALGQRWVFLGTLLGTLLAGAATCRTRLGLAGFVVSIVLIALTLDQRVTPLGREFMTPLDEGMVMDMPITVPRASVTQSADDLKARDMVFCRFPEVDMVVGKAGRADTPTDPAPLDMIETMVNFRPPEFWPKRELREADAMRQAERVWAALVAKGVVADAGDAEARHHRIHQAVDAAMPLFDHQMREYAYGRNQQFERELGPPLVRYVMERTAARTAENGALDREPGPGDVSRLTDPAALALGPRLASGPTLEDVTFLARKTAGRIRELGWAPKDTDLLQERPGLLMKGVLAVHSALGGEPATFFTRLLDEAVERYRQFWKDHVRRLNGELVERAASLYTRLIVEELLNGADVHDPKVAAAVRERRQRRSEPPKGARRASGHHHHGEGGHPKPLPVPDPVPALDVVEHEAAREMVGWLLLWRKDRAELAGFGGELDRVMQMPGWTNVWTMPIQNRVDMLSTGVNTQVGIRVLGRRLDDVARASEAVAAAVKKVAGAVDVVADPVRGKGYLEVHLDRERAAREGVQAMDVTELVEVALGGKVATMTVEGRERHPVRVRFPRAWSESEDAVANLMVPARPAGADTPRYVPLSRVADVGIAEGPAAIKSENGLLRNYVRLNVRCRDVAEFVEEARRKVAAEATLPEGVFLEWTGQFEHELRATRTLLVIVPLVLGLIFLILFWTYRDLTDAVLMMLAVPGVLAGGVFFQWLFGYKFSTTVWIGYIACFGMATATGIIMLVYLRDAVARAGGLAAMSRDQLRQAVLNGAVHRLRPKLLTEGTIVLGLAPMLWATGVGAEVIKPMAAPVLGGILIADEVIDLLLPVLFYRVRLRRWRKLQPATAKSDA